MQNTSNNFRGGIQFHHLSKKTGTDALMSEGDDSEEDLGLLKELRGTWKGAPNNGWNIISIPAPSGFDFEVIPYSEELTFLPTIVSAGNVGPVLNNQENNQTLVGLMYEQKIMSSCTDVPEEDNKGFTRVCKFENDHMIHAETGFFLNIENFNSGLNLTRLATIPHGNSVLQLGSSSSQEGTISDRSFIGKANVLPTRLDGGELGFPETHALDYHVKIATAQFPDFPAFNQEDPNSALRNGLKYKTKNGDIKEKTILEMVTLNLSTEFDKAGILNIPFLRSNVDATKMTTTFWIQKIQGEKDSLNKDEQEDYWQLQYTQTIDLVFPTPFNPTPIIWPHVTVNTLRKVSDTAAKK